MPTEKCEGNHKRRRRELHKSKEPIPMRAPHAPAFERAQRIVHWKRIVR
ncbi:MAG: hypothetical protein NTX50_17175 [Candidatus Sumerlaeota bacterium]|nr:hypothetical protein [Candidatus Sumerlaeota bacterium]